MRGRLRYTALEVLKLLPEKPFLASELETPVPGATLRYLMEEGCIALVGRGGIKKRYWVWRLTDTGRWYKRRGAWQAQNC